MIIITMFTQYFKECQPFFLTFTTRFSKSWHRLNEPFCLTLERICCPQSAASGNRSVHGANKTAVVLEPSQ